MAKRHERQGREERADLAALATAVPATEAQNNFGAVLNRAMDEGVVVITKYNRPAAVVMSMSAYETHAASTRPRLDVLTAAFDAMVARMPTQQAAGAGDRFFAMSSEAIGRASAAARGTEPALERGRVAPDATRGVPARGGRLASRKTGRKSVSDPAKPSRTPNRRGAGA